MSRPAMLLSLLVLAACDAPDEDASSRASTKRTEPTASVPDPKRDCLQGDNASCNALLEAHLGQGDEAGRRRAAALSRQLCEDDRTPFCTAYAMALATGSGVDEDRERARALFEAHCDADPQACSQYGNLFAAGRGVEQDLGLAWLLLGEACDQQNAQACDELDPLLEHACGQGVPTACNELAVLRTGGAAPTPETVQLFERACELGDTRGCKNAQRAREAAERPPKP